MGLLTLAGGSPARWGCVDGVCDLREWGFGIAGAVWMGPLTSVGGSRLAEAVWTGF